MNHIYLRSLFAAAALFALLTAPPAQGATIVEVSGPNENGNISSVADNLLVSFSTPVDYVNVSIEVSLWWQGGGDMTLNAYLTDQVGPGTTALANEIASTATVISLPFQTITPYTVFSGLDLAAGDYNLILSGFGPWWVGSTNASTNIVENDGAAVTRSFATGLSDAYLPATLFTDVEDQNLWFKVTGDRAPVSGVPEPSTLALFGIGAMALTAIKRRRTRRSSGR